MADEKHNRESPAAPKAGATDGAPARPKGKKEKLAWGKDPFAEWFALCAGLTPEAEGLFRRAHVHVMMLSVGLGQLTPIQRTREAMATALRTTPALAERGIKRLVDAGLVEETPEGLMPKFTPHIWRDREQNIEKSRENGRRNQPKVRQNSEKDRRKESKNNDSEETGGSKHCQDTTGTKSPIEGDFDPGSAGAPAEPAARPATATVPNEAPIEPQERPAWAETHKHLLMPMAQHRLPFEAWVKYVRDSGHDALADALVAERSMRTVALYPSENAALPLMLDGTSGPQVSSRLMPTVAADVDPIAAVGEHRSAVMSSEHPQGAEPGEHGDMPMAQRAGPSSLGDGEATTTARAHTNGRIPDDS